MAKVQLEGNQTDGYHLILDGAPFFVKGAGLEFGLLESLANAGVIPLEPGASKMVCATQSVFSTRLVSTGSFARLMHPIKPVPS